MDRDKRWDRTELAYRLYTSGDGRIEADPIGAVMAAYERNETDEFVRPIAIAGDGSPGWPVRDGDDCLPDTFLLPAW